LVYIFSIPFGLFLSPSLSKVISPLQLGQLILRFETISFNVILNVFLQFGQVKSTSPAIFYLLFGPTADVYGPTHFTPKVNEAKPAIFRGRRPRRPRLTTAEPGWAEPRMVTFLNPILQFILQRMKIPRLYKIRIWPSVVASMEPKGRVLPSGTNRHFCRLTWFMP
jgi:hypothetical protein